MTTLYVKIHMVVSAHGSTTYGIKIFDVNQRHLLGLTYQGISGEYQVVNRYLEIEAMRVIHNMYGKDCHIINITTKKAIV